MSDPFKPDSQEDAESQRPPEKPEQRAEQNNLPYAEKDPPQAAFKTSSSNLDDTGLQKLDLEVNPRSTTAAYSFPLGQKPAYQLKKSEFLKPEEERSVLDLKPLISNFLNDTEITSEHKLEVAELKELYRNREALSSAQNLHEAVTRTLQLTRLYQHLKYIEEAKKARDLLLGLDPHHQLGKQLFKEVEHMHPVDISISAASATMPLIAGLTKRALTRAINRLTGGRVIVLGDLLIDELLEGRPERISREAPVLILEHVNTELILGGAANTAGNLAALGGSCHTVGVCGRDEYARKLARLFETAGINHSLVEDPSRPTTVKTRILSSAHALRQQLLRMDRISHEQISVEISNRLVEKLRTIAPHYDAVILSDYKSGLITSEVVAGCLEVAAQNDLEVIVDAQNDFSRFRNAALITPNQPDTEAAVGFKITSKETLDKAGKMMLEISGAKAMLITRGADGMVLFQEKEMPIELPAFNRSEVFDVTGAGDTVVATMTLALVTGSSYLEAMALGNLAAGIVVKKSGTAVTNQKEMLEALNALKLDD
ncbi:MAG: bifunctional hydroxymethylpyrimidine kinase/phosphomethylpyrimidine kinase [Candidatus Obscuribacterales bacterium]|nr:bifunctional hydroxymethylpyrimidine kinase/phosphomethylpyrimidine kinase [Candidatus Obscuribacterales bacterium]